MNVCDIWAPLGILISNEKISNEKGGCVSEFVACSISGFQLMSHI